MTMTVLENLQVGAYRQNDNATKLGLTVDKYAEKLEANLAELSKLARGDVANHVLFFCEILWNMPARRRLRWIRCLYLPVAA